jgi:hypothetical protein
MSNRLKMQRKREREPEFWIRERGSVPLHPLREMTPEQLAVEWKWWKEFTKNNYLAPREHQDRLQ